MKQIKLLLIATFCLLASGCNQQDWLANFNVWKAQSQNYQYTLRTTTNSVPADVEVNVVDGKVDTAFLLVGTLKIAVTGAPLLALPTIQGHFMVIAPQLLDASKTFEYHPTLGYPMGYSQILPKLTPDAPEIVVEIEILDLQLTQ